MDLSKNKDQSVQQYIWRVCQYKDNGLFEGDWKSLAKIINENCCTDQADYKGQSVYRKAYHEAKRFYESGVFENLNMEEYYIQKQELKKEKQKLSDERTALNKRLRETARAEQNFDILKELIKKNGRTTLPSIDRQKTDGDGNDLVVCLSDIHLGLDVSNSFGTYNSDVTKDYIINYLKQINKIRVLNKSENVYVLLLGDLISGNIHSTIRLENRENIIRQVQMVSELCSNFIYELSKEFNTVFVNSIAGNHSRIGLKDEVLRNERLDDFIPWYAKAKLSHIENVKFIQSANFDNTIGQFEIRGKYYWMVHGDYDQFSESGISKLVMMIGYKPQAIFTGHMHHCSYEDVSNVKYIRSGSFSGACDDYCVSKRITGRPTQMVCCVSDEGIKSLYPIDLMKRK